VRNKRKQEIYKKMVALTQESSEKKFQGCSCTADLKSNESTLEKEIRKSKRKLLEEVSHIF
jgi:hypothetical protein